MILSPSQHILALERRVEEIIRQHEVLREALSVMEARVRAVENRLLELEAEHAAMARAAGMAPRSEAGTVTQVTRQDSETGKSETRLVMPGPTRLQ